MNPPIISPFFSDFTDEEKDALLSLPQEQRVDVFRKLEIIKEAESAPVGLINRTIQEIAYKRHISASSIIGWRQKFRKDGVLALIDARLARRITR